MIINKSPLYLFIKYIYNNPFLWTKNNILIIKYLNEGKTPKIQNYFFMFFVN